MKKYAVSEKNSLGREYPENKSPLRNDFQRDRDRINLHLTLMNGQFPSKSVIPQASALILFETYRLHDSRKLVFYTSIFEKRMNE